MSISAAGATSPSMAVSPYRSAYDSLMQQDASELLNVSLGSASDASANVANVLAQAASLQQQQLAAQQQAQGAPPPAITAPVVPTLASVIRQSMSAATSDLSKGTLGASIDSFA